jgi:hypothetical protein
MSRTSCGDHVRTTHDLGSLFKSSAPFAYRRIDSARTSGTEGGGTISETMNSFLAAETGLVSGHDNLKKGSVSLKCSSSMLLRCTGEQTNSRSRERRGVVRPIRGPAPLDLLSESHAAGAIVLRSLAPACSRKGLLVADQVAGCGRRRPRPCRPRPRLWGRSLLLPLSPCTPGRQGQAESEQNDPRRPRKVADFHQAISKILMR